MTPESTAMRAIPGEVPASTARLGRAQWTDALVDLRETGGRLVALWGSDAGDAMLVSAAIAMGDGLRVVELALGTGEKCPDLCGLFAGASRMQRAASDLVGIEFEGARDTRPWLRHGAWPAGEFPLRRGFDPARERPNPQADYAFVRVEGDGVHEIPVGPIHAGIIEPGHFRFSVVGEKVLRLEERLGYAHKGIERRFQDFSVADGYRLAGRVSGDSAVAFQWAYAQAAESIAGVAPPPRARWLRALMLERERVANHLGDLGALGNDAALAFALSQFMRLKEDWLRLQAEAFGHRLCMDRIVPGGVDADLDDSSKARFVDQAAAIGDEVRSLQVIFDESSSLQDRFITTGRLTPDQARAFGVTGLAGRASGQPFDLRADLPCDPYPELAVRKVVHESGDVATRVKVRFEELYESLRLIAQIARRMPAGPTRIDYPQPPAGALGVGFVEGWRGETFVALRSGEGGTIARCHAHDPSWHAWPAIEHAVIGNIVPDFPLINKSFNLSYSGQDC
ncbi:MAG TPA: NADH-quinone oxidoreductase subunit C [Usitatibacter sp.]|nr:NADH-quinone oxidoreductase subunit C [Usitatibacter sp.]